MTPSKDAGADRVAELEAAIQRWARHVDDLEAERDRLKEALAGELEQVGWIHWDGHEYHSFRLYDPKGESPSPSIGYPVYVHKPDTEPQIDGNSYRPD